MAASPAKFYFGFLIVCIILWMIFTICLRLFAWMLSRVLGASVSFGVGSWKCLLDVKLKFEMGEIESVSIGEIKISSLKPLFKLGVGFLSGEQKMQVLIFLISDLEVVTRFSSALFFDQLSLTTEFGYGREVGMVIDDVKLVSGDVILIFDEDLFPGRMLSSDDAGMTNTIKKQMLTTLAKYSTSLPNNVSFSLTKLDVICVNRGNGLVAQNYAKGLQLRIVKSNSVEDTNESTTHLDVESTRLNVHIGISEIHLFREAKSSVLEIAEVDLVFFIDIPIQPVLPIRVGVHLKIGGTHCNLFVSRLQPWLHLQEGTHTLENSEETTDDMKTIMWIGIVSAPEMSVMLYTLDDLPRYHFCWQSTRVFANSYSSMNTSIDVEVVNMNLHLADEYQENPNSISLMHIAKLSLGWGRRDDGASSSDEVAYRSKVTVGVTRMGLDFSFTRVESLINYVMSFGDFFKTLYVGTDSTGGVEAPGTGTRLVYLNIGRYFLSFHDDRIINDPNSIGGLLRYLVSLEISKFSFCLNKDEHSTRMKLERVKSIYQEYMDQEHQPCTKVILFDMHEVKHVRRRYGGLNKIDVRSFLSASDISLDWEPGAHLSLYEIFMWLRFLVYKKDISNVRDGGPSDLSQEIFGIDLKMLTVSAEVGDGVEIKLELESVFSENASLRVLVEKSMLACKGSRVLNTTRMQISRAPTASSDAIPGAPWHWVIQGPDVHICMPYNLHFCSIADSTKEMFQGLRISTEAIEEKYILPGMRESSEPNGSSQEFGSLRLCIEKLTAYIEEEPMQGWFDEHYQLLKKEACELAVRLKFLEALKSSNGGEVFFDGAETDVEYPLDINKEKENIHNRSFQSYYRACQRLAPLEGSSACREGIQAGFKPSAARTSLFSVCATNLDLSMKVFQDIDASLNEILKKIDPICENFSKSNVDLRIGSLVVQLRNYTLPLFSATFGKCQGHIVTFPIAYQKTEISQEDHVISEEIQVISEEVQVIPQEVHAISEEDQVISQEDQVISEEVHAKSEEDQVISQEVHVGRWRKVKISRSKNDTTMPMKVYLDLPILFEKGDVSFGVGYEPAVSDVSYAFTLALSHKNSGASQVTGKEQQSLTWWDYMRNYIHGKITLYFSESKWNVLATTNLYESQDKLQMVTGLIKFQQLDGSVIVTAEDFKIKLSSLESLISRHSLEVPVNPSRAAFLEAPLLNLEVMMDWGCEYGDSNNVFDQLRATSLTLQWNLSFRAKNSDQFSSPTINLGAHDLAWILKLWGMITDPPQHLRSFSIWPRFRVPRIAKSKNLSLDMVMTEFMLRVEATPSLIKYMPWDSRDPAKELVFSMQNLKYELCCSRGKQEYTFECKRDALDLVYQCLDLHLPKAFTAKDGNEGFLLSCDSFIIRRQAPKADPERLLAWQKAGRRNLEVTSVRPEHENGSEIVEHIQSNPSNNDENNAFIADNCQHVFVYGLKLLWTKENIDVIYSLVGGISEAFEPPKPSPTSNGGQNEISESEEVGTRCFMVNFIEPQFNLHSQEANGHFLLAVVSGSVLARSFHSGTHVPTEVIGQNLGTNTVHIPEYSPGMTWKRMEISIMLEHVQAHVALTDVNLDAELQWLPKVCKNSPDLNHTGTLLEMVFMPCHMYSRYTIHQSGTSDLKVKALRELTFRSPNITSTMTSQQFQVMLDILTNFPFAKLPNFKSSIQCPTDEDDVEDETDEIVSYGVEEVETAKSNLKKKDQDKNLLLDDIRILSYHLENMDNTHMERESELWMISTRRSILVNGLKKQLLYARKSRKMASISLRLTLQKVAQLQLMEQEDNNISSYVMCISLKINKVVWSMLADGRSFAEAKINDLMFEFDRDFEDIGVARFTIKYFVLRNCMPNSKSDMVLSAWNPPTKWRKKFMLHVDAKWGAPIDGNYPFELLQVEIYPLRIHLTVAIYKMVWEYFFPEKKHNSKRQQEVRQKKSGKSKKEKKINPRKIMIHNIKIIQMELLLTYERLRIKDMKLLMDTFHNVEFTGTWPELFSQVKMHMIWGVMKSLTKMQGNKFEGRSKNNHESSDSDQHQVTWFKHHSDGAMDGFITSIQEVFNIQRSKGKSIAFDRERSDNDIESSPFAAELTIPKDNSFIRRLTKKLRPNFEISSTSKQIK